MRRSFWVIVCLTLVAFAKAAFANGCDPIWAAKPLTKSKCMVGLECATKLYYEANPEYSKIKGQGGGFLQALAEGGFQVGELAKLYFPSDNVSIITLEHDAALAQTTQAMQRKKVTIFEGAYRHKILFARVDILRKVGNKIHLYEVKSKSFDWIKDKALTTLYGNSILNNKWTPYVLDLAFQTHIVRSAYPDYQVVPHLMLVDREKVATVDGLNQLFVIEKTQNGRSRVVLSKHGDKKNLGEKLLTDINLEDEINSILTVARFPDDRLFLDVVNDLGHYHYTGEKCPPKTGVRCRECEFRVPRHELGEGKLSGFEECWTSAYNLKPEDFDKPFVFDVWNFRDSHIALLMKTIFAAQLSESQVNAYSYPSPSGLTHGQRRWLQVQAARSTKPKIYFDKQGLAGELAKLPAPYHFIDFETTTVAIPFHQGQRPYQQIAFQFSHHVVDENGNIEERKPYLNLKRGAFPNFDFIRQLKKALSQDQGTVFRFGSHENTVLNQIYDQLAESDERDKKSLMAWIRSIATPTRDHRGEWSPTRPFVDMREIILRRVYLPETHGSNSIKKLLPAVLNAASQKTRNKFKDWIQLDADGRVKDPYSLLPPIFDGVDADELARMEMRLVHSEWLKDGAAASTAWSRMQFTEMSPAEFKALRDALLRYCGLDTMAMVMIWEWWHDRIASR